jgi:CHAD domain-containing protein
MEHTIADKWVSRLSPDQSVHAAAVHTLQDRLGAVEHYLRLAAKEADKDVEHVHELRVWSRRATAALALYEETMPRRRFAWLKKQLRRVRRAANDARDCDVLVQRLRTKPRSRGTKRWLEAAVAERAEAQRAILAVYERLEREDRFARRIRKLLDRVASRGDDQGPEAQRFGDWARQRLRDVVERFFAAVPVGVADAAALHHFRIRGKELRYVMELLAVVFPDQLRTELYPVIEAMQDRLGEINDLVTAQARLREKIEQSTKPAEASDWRRLLAAEEAQLDQGRRQCWDWCTHRCLH